ncbi:hypothetical protein BX616_009682 [Lobosporangium transversale]|uniref:WD-repeat region-domain-containing protein n=1 Tax=Lobosporangium transversale TaxID=64571 RepID=A0A1Y2GEV7_9FUNG|nr:WD-repeat region-domain-containing protein [Lobosporangium transversale]KAF9913739.1 hypothetical protein BX616_009682 [Lobosporangium transversale]ORZ08813.1 WD-repeat region-domain-containing protein [Lobosporangium transversale]|eukprot:XP_021878596.1 WD-repeat region-domain-containing protein [Lobosporangium transversale]
MQSFPLLLEWSTDPVMYHGFLSVMDRELEIWIELPYTANRRTETDNNIKSKSTTGQLRLFTANVGVIFGTDELQKILEGHEAQLQKKMDEASNMEEFLAELVDTLEAILSSKKTNAEQQRSLSYWTHVIKQLDALGWERVTNLNKDLSQAQIELSDASGRKHLLTVDFPPGYPAVPFNLKPLEIPEHDIQRLSQTLTSKSLSLNQENGLLAAVECAEKQLRDFTDFWDVMQDIDDKTWVVDPEKPTKADCMRRCVLGNHCTIQIVIDPTSPRSMPETRLIGPASSIESMRTKLYKNVSLWDKMKLPRENLEALLELPNGFPTPVTASKEEINIECGICYSFRYEGQIPDQLCSNIKCQQPFHRACLYDWLRNLTTTRQSFNTLFGVCPYCNETITTTAPRA